MKKTLSLVVIAIWFLGGFGVVAQAADLIATIVTPSANVSYQVGQVVPFAGNATGGNLPYNFHWDFGDSTTAAGQSYDKTYTQAGNYTTTLLVTDVDNNHATITQNISVTAVPPPPAPTVDLKVNNVNGPVALATGATANLSWTSTDATACTASGVWSGSKATSGTEATGALNTAGASIYTLTCTGAGGTIADSVTINVAASPASPTVDLKVNNSDGPLTVATGTVATLTWTSTNTTACTASGVWSGAKATSGTEATGALNTVGAFSYTLTCTGAGGSIADSVTVNTQAASTTGAAPVISNIRVDGVTQTSAVVHWTTDIPADSRVVYDTVSHLTLGSAPNFGYAFSSNTLNASPKVTEHAVTLTGLTANTPYFFRVLSQS